jgi:hypothetical protein
MDNLHAKRINSAGFIYIVIVDNTYYIAYITHLNKSVISLE